MLDVGWSELLIIGLVALIVVGPKELPGLMRSIGAFINKIKMMASSFQRQFEQAVEESEIGQIRSEVEDVGREFSPEKIMGGFDRYRQELDEFDPDEWNRNIMEGPGVDEGFEPPDHEARAELSESGDTPATPGSEADASRADFDKPGKTS